MGAWKDVSKAVRVKTRATAYYLKEKNHRAAVMNRLRAVIRCEEKAAEKEYLALGRYYYNALRDPDNPLAETHCARIDQINARRDSALENLEQLGQEEAASIGVIAGKDGPTAAYRAPVFRFHKGQTEMTVTPQEDEVEEVDLSDVACFDYDPTLPQPSAQEAEAPAVPQAAEIEAQPQEGTCRPANGGTRQEGTIRPAELDENDGLLLE